MIYAVQREIVLQCIIVALKLLLHSHALELTSYQYLMLINTRQVAGGVAKSARKSLAKSI